MKEFYVAYYAAIEQSQAHHTFCERVFGKDVGQHGFADLAQLDLIVQVTRLGPLDCVLDLGCGNGMITEYLSDRTGAHVTGLDYIGEAIHHAQQRTAAKAERLAFVVGDINQLYLPPHAFDLIVAIDTIYFSEDFAATIRDLKAALRPAGQIAILFSYGCEPWIPKEDFPKETLPPDKTPLALALIANDLPFCTYNLTHQEYELAQKRRALLAELKPQFEAEGTLFIYENRIGDTEGICQAIEDGLHVRYLYHVQLDALN